MPGYGYAQAAKAVKEDWQGLMFDFLRGRPTLHRVVLLLDARIELKASDTAVMDLLDRAAVTYQLVLTKADAVKPARWPQGGRGRGAGRASMPPPIPSCSPPAARRRKGIPALRASLAELAD